MAFCQRGDLWIAGSHRLLCDDSTDPASVKRLMAGPVAAQCFTSPPYLHRRTYISGIKDWDLLMQGAFRNLPLADNAQLFVNLGSIHQNNEEVFYWEEWREWMRRQGWLFRYQIPWDKLSGTPGRFTHFSPAHEYVLHFARQIREPYKVIPKNPDSISPRSKAPGLRGADGKPSRRAANPETSLWTHKIADSVIRVRKSNVRTGHPAVFPVEFPRNCILSFSDPGDIIYEPFGGSGSLVIAAERFGLRCYAMELEPEYVDLALARIQKETKIVPYRQSDGMPFGGEDWLRLPANIHRTDDMRLAA